MWGSAMHNLTIVIKKDITCNFSADQWGLLTNSFPRDEIEEVANKLNSQLNDYVNNDYSKKDTHDGMFNYLSQWTRYGAFDSEVRGFLDVVLEEIYK
jgi:hypothetical protein